MLKFPWPTLGALRKRPQMSLLLCASIVVPALLFAVYAVQARDAAMSDIEDRLARRAAFLAEHAARVFDTYGLMFDTVEHMLLQGVGTDVLDSRAQQMIARTDFTNALVIVDSSGRIVAGSLLGAKGLDVSDREYVTAAREVSGVVLSGQFVGRITNRAQFGLSRRSVDGHLMAATVRSLYFEKIFANVCGQDGFHGVAALFRADGTQLVRYPKVESLLKLEPGSPGLMSEIPRRPSGVYRVDRPQVGGRAMIYAFHQVADLPAYVTYGIAVSEGLATWRESMVFSGLLAAAAAALLGGGTLLAIRRVEQAQQAEILLQQAVAARTAEVVDAVRDREEALKAAERAHNAKAHFLAAASHDLRQPIQALRLFLEVLKARLTDA